MQVVIVKHCQLVLGVVSGNGKTALNAYLCILLGWLSAQGKTTLTEYICVLGVLSSQVKTTLIMLTVYICVLGVLSGQGKTTLTVYICALVCFQVNVKQH